MPLSLGISAGTSLLGGLLGSSSSKSAAKKLNTAGTNAGNAIALATRQAQDANNSATSAAQQGVTGAAQNAVGTVNEATGNANALLASILGQGQNALAPYTAAGAQGVNALAAGFAPGGQFTQQFSFDPSQIVNNPDYQFQLQQGEQAVQRSQAAQGAGLGGAALKASDQYAQGLASNAVNTAYNQALSTWQTNRSNALSGLSSLANYGQQGTNSLLGLLQNYGNTAAANTLQGGYYGANTPLNAAQYSGNVGIQGQQYSGSTGIQGTQAAQNALLSALGAATGYQVQGTNSIANGLTGTGNAFANFAALNTLNPYSAASPLGQGYGAYGTNPFGTYSGGVSPYGGQTIG